MNLWVAAIWGCVGSAANLGVVFLEAMKRGGGWPWKIEHGGPGLGPYVAELVIKLLISGAAVAALSTNNTVTNGWVAFGAGAAGTTLVKKAYQMYGEATGKNLPRVPDPESAQRLRDAAEAADPDGTEPDPDRNT